jgi:hypothetical protein
LKIGCIEEIASWQGFISDETLAALNTPWKKGGYQGLLACLEEKEEWEGSEEREGLKSERSEEWEVYEKSEVRSEKGSDKWEVNGLERSYYYYLQKRIELFKT